MLTAYGIETNLMSALGSGPQLKRFTINIAALTGAAASETIDLCTLPKGSVIEGVRIKPSVIVAGGGVGTYTVSVGSAAGSTSVFATAVNLMAAVSNLTFQLSDQFNAATYAEDTLQATFTADTTTGAATSGQVHIDVYYWAMTTPDTYL
jgi:hypothetical protein